MRMGLVIAASLAVAACGEQAAIEPGDTGGQETGEPCSQSGQQEGILSEECAGQIVGQVIGDETSFFSILLDGDANLFVQGLALPDGGVVFEVPGPQYTQLTNDQAEAILAIGFVPNAETGMFTLPVAGTEPRAADPGKLVVEAAEALGFAKGDAISYEVAEMFTPF